MACIRNTPCWAVGRAQRKHTEAGMQDTRQVIRYRILVGLVRALPALDGIEMVYAFQIRLLRMTMISDWCEAEAGGRLAHDAEWI